MSFLQNKKIEAAVHDVSFSLYQNEILGMVGESGSGKSITSLALLGLLPKGIAKVDGAIFYNEENKIYRIEERIDTLHLAEGNIGPRI